jgi:hypothetical protein
MWLVVVNFVIRNNISKECMTTRLNKDIKYNISYNAYVRAKVNSNRDVLGCNSRCLYPIILLSLLPFCRPKQDVPCSRHVSKLNVSSHVGGGGLGQEQGGTRAGESQGPGIFTILSFACLESSSKLLWFFVVKRAGSMFVSFSYFVGFPTGKIICTSQF